MRFVSTGPDPCTTPAVAPVCQAFCKGNAKPWSTKCGWAKLCGGCPECGSSACTTPAPVCQAFCKGNAQPWSTKCGWAKLCGGCPECEPTTSTAAPVPGQYTVTYERDFQPCQGCSPDAVSCSDWTPLSASTSLGQCGSYLCCQIKSACDVCNGHKDKPEQLRLRWVSNGEAPTSVTFSSDDICVASTTLTSGTSSNEVVLDAETCFGSKTKLPTNIYFTVDGSSKSLHASCSQPLNVGDVLYTDPSKGFLVLVGFRALSGRTDGECSDSPPPQSSSNSHDQCTCDNAEQCYGEANRRLRQQHYRLECESVDPKICEAITHVNIEPEDCSTATTRCSFTNGFEIEICPCSGKCFDGNSCQSSKCPCNSIDCSDLSSQKPSLLDHINKNECICQGDTPCLAEFTRAECDVCDLRKDKPQMLTFGWVGNGGAQNSIRFESDNICGTDQILTSGTDSNKVVLEASCFQYGSKLPTNIHFKVDGNDHSLHASCSQPLNVGDVVYNDPSKGSLVLVDFRSVTGRTAHNCPDNTVTCGTRSYTPPSLSCDAGFTLVNPKSAKGVDLRVNPDSTVQYMWNEAQHSVSTSWTDEFEYTAVSCDGEKVNAKVLITVDTPWVNPQDCTEVVLTASSRRVANEAECTKSCTDTPECKSTKFRKKGWCTHFGTSCSKALNSKAGVGQMEQDVQGTADLSPLHGVTNALSIVMIVHLLCAFSFQ